MRQLFRRIPIPVLFALLAFSLYLPGFWWGAPYASAPDRTHAWGVDDETPLGALGEVYHIITRSRGENLGYPLLYYFVVSAATAPYLGILFMTRQVTAVSASYPFGLVEPIAALQG